MKEAALLLGLFWIGFYAAEVIGAIAKRETPVFANIVLGLSFPCVGYYFI